MLLLKIKFYSNLFLGIDMMPSGMGNTAVPILQQIQQQQLHNVGMQNVPGVSGIAQSQMLQQQQFLAWQQMQQQQNPQQQQFYQQQQLQRSKKQQMQHQQPIMLPTTGNPGGIPSASNSIPLKADWGVTGMAGPTGIVGNMSSQLSGNMMINGGSNTGSGGMLSMQQSLSSAGGGGSHIKDESKHNLQQKILQRMSNFNNITRCLRKLSFNVHRKFFFQ